MSKGPSQQFSESITEKSKKLLFIDYMTYKDGGNNYILVKQILE